MLVHLQPSMLKPFGSSQCYTPNTFSNRAQRYTTPSFKINEVLEGAKKTTEEARDTISEATKLEQESDALTTSPDEFIAEPDISTSFPKKEHIFDPTINNMTAAKKNMKWYTSEPQISINPPPFLKKLKYSNTAETIAGRQTEMLSKEKVMDRTQMQTFKKGVEKMQRRGISTADGLLMKKSATVQVVAKNPSKMLDCPEEEPKKSKEEPVRMSPDGKKCFLSPKPYVPQPCACVEPPPMIDVPLKRLPPKCPPEEHEVCYPERICPEEVCLRADENLCVKPKKLPLLEPAECPCIEPGPMKDVPLKRLDLHVAEQPRICPCVEDCPCPRADENLEPKFKKLRKIVPGECPCIEPSYRDVNFKRLECIDEPEPCDLTDPCIPYPRADYGCWEYYTPEKCTKAKKQAKKPKPRKIINFKPQKRCYRVEPKKSSFGVSVEKLKSNTLTRLEKNELTPHRNPPVKILIKSKVPNIPHKSGTIVLLDKLKNLQTQSSDNKIRFDRPKSSKLDVRRIMNNVSALEKENATTTASAPVRNLSTVQVSKLPTMAPKKDHKCSTNQDCGKKPKGCNKGTCPSSHTDNCPAGERRPYCKKKKVVDCCEKPPSPYPSFSELMEGQIEPFSEFSEWTCKRKEYGFYPKTTKEFEPLDIKKNKKCFSTMAFNVKELLDESPEDLRSAFPNLFDFKTKDKIKYIGKFQKYFDTRGAKMNDMHVAEATSQRLDNGNNDNILAESTYRSRRETESREAQQVV
nr:unnamed protein product [Callosobruchus chinensis]